MVNCLNVKKYILSIVSENFAVSVSQEVSDTKSKSRYLSRFMSIPYILYFSYFAIVVMFLLSLRPQSTFNKKIIKTVYAARFALFRIPNRHVTQCHQKTNVTLLTTAICAR
jgi:hypothetical protein